MQIFSWNIAICKNYLKLFMFMSLKLWGEFVDDVGEP